MTLDRFLSTAFASSSFTAMGFLLAAVAVVAAIEFARPLQARKPWNTIHLAPNFALTIIYLATNLFLTAALVLTLAWFQAEEFGLLNAVAIDPWIELAATLFVLDVQAYTAHVAMHAMPGLWRFHRVHHADPAVGVTTTLRRGLAIDYGLEGFDDPAGQTTMSLLALPFHNPARRNGFPKQNTADRPGASTTASEQPWKAS